MLVDGLNHISRQNRFSFASKMLPSYLPRHRLRSPFDFMCCEKRKHADPIVASHMLDE